MQVYVCDAFTGRILDRLPHESVLGGRKLSAGEQGSVVLPLDGSIPRSTLRGLLTPWERIIVIDRDGKPEFAGYSMGRDSSLGGSFLTVKLQDVWALHNRRGGWDRDHPYTAAWSTSVTGTRGEHAWQAIHRGRNTGVLNLTRYPVTKVDAGGGAVVTRKYHGYLFEMITDIHENLMDEGLDIYYEPRWVNGSDGRRIDWAFRAGMQWRSGKTHEFRASVQNPVISELTESDDASRMTNNAARIGEGSEVDMLARSRFDSATSFPILDRITSVKTISDPLALDSQALNDLAMYSSPTGQLNFKVLASEGVDVGDMARIEVRGHPWIEDGWHTRRVVAVSFDDSEFVRASVQAVGGA